MHVARMQMAVHAEASGGGRSCSDVSGCPPGPSPMFRRSGSSVPKVLLRLCGEDELRCRGGDAMAMVA